MSAFTNISIKFKRGPKASLPNEAPLGQPIYATDTNEFFIGQGPGLPLKLVNENAIKSYNTSLPATGEPGKIYTVENDPNNNNQATMYVWKNNAFEMVSGGGGGGGGVSAGNQLTKLGVTASQASPNVNEIIITETLDFNRIPVEVLKFEPGTDNIVSTLVNFDNADATDFDTTDPQVVFDGKMHLKTTYETAMTGSNLGTGKMFEVVINKNDYAKIEKIEVI